MEYNKTFWEADSRFPLLLCEPRFANFEVLAVALQRIWIFRDVTLWRRVSNVSKEFTAFIFRDVSAKELELLSFGDEKTSFLRNCSSRTLNDTFQS
jgi:hypothetical protein